MLLLVVAAQKYSVWPPLGVRLSDHYAFVKTTLEAVGLRLPSSDNRFAALGRPRQAYRRETMPALHTLCRDIARKYRYRDVDVVLVSGIRSLSPARLIADYLTQMTGRTVKVIQVVTRRCPPTAPGRRGKLAISIYGGGPSDIKGKGVLLFEDVIRQQSLLPHLGKETRYAGGTVVGIASFVAYNGVSKIFNRRMSTFFLPKPVFDSRSAVLAEYRVERASQLGRSNLWRHRAKELGKILRLAFTKRARRTA